MSSNKQETVEYGNDWTSNLPPPNWSEVKQLQEKISKLENRVDLLEEALNPTQFWLKKTIENEIMPAQVKRECRICSVSHDSFVPNHKYDIIEDEQNPKAVALLNVYNNPFLPRLVQFKAKAILEEKHVGYLDAFFNETDIEPRNR